MSGIIGDNTGRSTGLIKAAGGGGKLLQVVGTSTTDTDTTTSVNSWVDYGMSQAITPTAAGSKILICVAVDINADGFTCCKVVRDIASGGYGDITGMIGDARGNRQRSFYGGNHISHGNGSVQFLDSPSYSLGNAFTYKVQWMAENTITGYRNRRDIGDTDQTYHQTNISVLTLMEIGA